MNWELAHSNLWSARQPQWSSPGWHCHKTRDDTELSWELCSIICMISPCLYECTHRHSYSWGYFYLNRAVGLGHESQRLNWGRKWTPWVMVMDNVSLPIFAAGLGGDCLSSKYAWMTYKIDNSHHLQLIFGLFAGRRWSSAKDTA